MRSNSNSDRFRGFFGLIMVLIFHPAVVFMVLSCPFVVQGHPFCGREDGGGAQGKFPVASDAMVCNSIYDGVLGVCCTEEEAEAISTKYESDISTKFKDRSARCQEMYKHIMCAPCDPYQAHLYDMFGTEAQLCRDFCFEYVEECGLSIDFCDDRTSDNERYCLPYDYTKAMPQETPGTFEEAFGDGFGNGLRIVDIKFRPDTGIPWIVNQWDSIVQINGPIGSNWPGQTNIISRGELGGIYTGGNVGEMGLLGLEFHPSFGRDDCWIFYIYYYSTSDPSVAPRTSRLSVLHYDPDTGKANVGNEDVVLRIPQNWENHQGGSLMFSKQDRKNWSKATHYLYLSVGDGGGGSQYEKMSSQRETDRGRILRFKVNKQGSVTDKYAFAKGLRNPWRCSFDDNGGLWCDDVGQSRYESIFHITEGANLGWPCYEGDVVHENPPECKDVASSRTPPVYQYCHSRTDGNFDCTKPVALGNSVTGGLVYSGNRWPELVGVYVFADFESGNIWGLKLDGSKVVDDFHISTGKDGYRRITTFAEDGNGNVVIAAFSDDFANSRIYQLPCSYSAVSRCSGSATAPPTGPSDADPNCENGIRNGDACCPKHCGMCGGFGCHLLPGGASNCCTSHVANEGSCNIKSAPCKMMSSDVGGDPTCETGILSGDGKSCCPASCYKCGGSGCHLLPGGAPNCCTSHVANEGNCNIKSAPCKMMSSGVGGDPTCETGILSGDGKSCCPASCNKCGGSGCHLLPGGASNCCTSHVSKEGSCNIKSPPCSV